MKLVSIKIDDAILKIKYAIGHDVILTYHYAYTWRSLQGILDAVILNLPDYNTKISSNGNSKK